jgi:hypothetical protein
MKRYPKDVPVAVYWEDAGDHPAEWQDKAAPEPMGIEVVTYGLSLGVKRRNLLIAGTYCPEHGDVNSVSQIPVGCIKKVVRLKE